MNHEVILYMNIFLLIISVLQTFANLIVLIAYFRNEKCRKEDAIILLVSLASIDFLYAILFIPYLIYLLIGLVPYGKFSFKNSHQSITIAYGERLLV